jgi:hypothetical protein
MAKGTNHNFVAAKKMPKPILQTKLIMIEEDELNFSLIIIKTGICHAKVKNNTKLAVKLSVKGTLRPKKAPVIITKTKYIRFKHSNKIVFIKICESHKIFLLIQTANNPCRLCFFSPETIKLTIIESEPGRISVYHQLNAPSIK